MSKKRARLKVKRSIDMKDKSDDEVRRIYVEEMLPDCPEGNPMIAAILQPLEGFEQRITRIDVCEKFDEKEQEWTDFDQRGLPVVFAVGDCPCGGDQCREGWGWEFKARDLNMAGHRGSLWAVACPSNDKVVFDPVTGEINAPPPMGVNAEEWNSGRYKKSEWGNALTQLDKQTLAHFQQKFSEKRSGGDTWVVD